MTRNRWLLLIVALLVGWSLFGLRPGQWARPGGEVATTPATYPAETAATPAATPATTPIATPAEAPAADTTPGLPPEAQAVLQAIKNGGPYAYDRDGVVFGNFEGRLPKQARGYYHEYTVPTPGLNHRGPRRIVSGGNPPVVFYYTDDHYESFRRIEGQP